MPSKRRNNGRAKMNQGHTTSVTCSNCCRQCPKDKAIRKFTVKDIIDGASRDDLRAVQVYDGFVIPKAYHKVYYCVSCAIHARIVRGRSREGRRYRVPKKVPDFQKKEDREVRAE